MAESSRWYDPTTLSVVESVIGANGKPRMVNKRDAKARNLKRSVTSYLKFRARPGLEKWIRQKMILAALTTQRHPDESDDDFLSRIEQDGYEEGQKAADAGTAVHKAIEQYIRGELYDHAYKPHIEALSEAMKGTGLDLLGGEPEKVYICDTHACRIDWISKNGFAIVDFKTKEVIDSKTKAWDEQLLQLCGNWEAACPGTQPRLINAFVGRDDAKVYLHEWDAEDRLRGLSGWRHLVGHVIAMEGV